MLDDWCTPKQRYYIGNLIWESSEDIKKKVRIWCRTRTVFCRDALKTLSAKEASEIIDSLLRGDYANADFLLGKFFGEEEWSKLNINHD